MPLKVHCSQGHRLTVPVQRAGTKVRCPICNEKVQIPGDPPPDAKPAKPEFDPLAFLEEEPLAKPAAPEPEEEQPEPAPTRTKPEKSRSWKTEPAARGKQPSKPAADADDSFDVLALLEDPEEKPAKAEPKPVEEKRDVGRTLVRPGKPEARPADGRTKVRPIPPAGESFKVREELPAETAKPQVKPPEREPPVEPKPKVPAVADAIEVSPPAAKEEPPAKPAAPRPAAEPEERKPAKTVPVPLDAHEPSAPVAPQSTKPAAAVLPAALPPSASSPPSSPPPAASPTPPVADAQGSRAVAPATAPGQVPTAPKPTSALTGAATPPVADAPGSRAAAAPPSPAPSPTTDPTPPVADAQGSQTSELPGIDHRPDQVHKVYYIAAALAVLALFSLVPAVVELVDYVRARMDFEATPGLGPWVYCIFLVGLLQVAYAVYAAQLPDWSSVWVVAIICLLVAAAYATVLAMFMLAPTNNSVLAQLGVTYLIEQRRTMAALWCLSIISLNALVTFFAGQMSYYWHRTTLLVPTTARAT